MEDLIDQRCVHAHVRTDQIDVPIAAASPDQPQDGFRRLHDLHVGIFCPVAGQTVPDKARVDMTLEQSAPDLGKGLLPLLNQPDFIFHTGAAGAVQKLLCGIAGLLKGHEPGAHRVAV